jgi:AcrR family transcriptional regulator
MGGTSRPCTRGHSSDGRAILERGLALATNAGGASLMSWTERWDEARVRSRVKLISRAGSSSDLPLQSPVALSCTPVLALGPSDELFLSWAVGTTHGRQKSNWTVSELDSSGTNHYRYNPDVERQRMTQNDDDFVEVEPAQPGRKRDHSRDAEILDATLEVLAEVGAARLTMDMVAARAGAGKATIYRRWTSKAELVIDAVAQMKRNQVDLERLPDTGTLRGDLLGLFKPQSIEEGERKLKIMTGLASLLSQDQALADPANTAVVQPWAEAHFALMQRAVERGEISASADIGTLSQVIPSMAAYRTLVQRKPIDLAFLTSMVDGVIVPALRSQPPDAPTDSTGHRPDHTTSPVDKSPSPRRAERRTRSKP